jgi:Ser/Thr protein kinase RdoA (MazF antagonist)
MEDLVLAVLARYPAVLRQGLREPLGNRGGFSGARLWRLHTPAGPLCLRASAPAETAGHVAWRHRLQALARAAGHLFVPAVLATSEGGTFIEEAGRRWELMEWLPGQADYRTQPTPARLEAAARALALVHEAWQREGQACGACPAVLRRLEAARSWREPDLPLGGPIRPLLERLRDAVRRLPRLPRLLEPWLERPCAIQACLRDVWHDHLLFEGQRLTGLVDYAAVDNDGVAADLARMLGSLVEDDERGWKAALAAYRSVRDLPAAEEERARLLDRTGAVVALANWLRWLAEGQRPFEQMGRVEELLRRVESWRNM